MKNLLLTAITLLIMDQACTAQSLVQDQSLRYQQERMVYLQWDKNKFTPTAGFLGLNPYYWLVWGLFNRNYHKTDRRPLSINGPQTQRLALVAALNATDNSYRLQSDTLRNTALSVIANHSGLITETDPLWQLYYSKELKPVIDYAQTDMLGSLPATARNAVVSEGLYNWYLNELAILKERIDAARTTTLDRGSRIMAYHRFLLEYRKLSAVWNLRIAAAAKNIRMSRSREALLNRGITVSGWTPQTDIRIAREVLTHMQ